MAKKGSCYWICNGRRGKHASLVKENKKPDQTRRGNDAFMVKGNKRITQGNKKPKKRKHERLFLSDPAF